MKRMLIAGALLSMPGLMAGWLSQTPRALNTPTAQAQPAVEGSYRWLIYKTSKLTGFVDSYETTRDTCTSRQAFTYDQAIAGIAFCSVGDCPRAKKLLDAFETRWRADHGLANAYSAINGRVGLESTVHTGVNLWVALLALHYDAMAGDRHHHYRQLALEIAKWASQLPHYRGGVAMGPRDDRAPWTRIVATEHVLDYYAVLNVLSRVASSADRVWIGAELDSSATYLRGAYNPGTGAMNRGLAATPGTLGSPPQIVADTNRALDTITWAIDAVSPAQLYAWHMDPWLMMDYATREFLVTIRGVRGFDFTDAAGRRAVHRDSTISLEWTGHAIVALRRLAEYSASTRPDRSVEYSRLADELTAGMDSLALRGTQNTWAYPYATSAHDSVFAGGWTLPDSTPRGSLSGSVAGTAWRIFAAGYNPMASAQHVLAKGFADSAVTPLDTLTSELEASLTPSCTCTSSGLVDAAWLNLDARREDRSMQFATETVHRFLALAESQQQAKGALIPYRDDEGGRARIFHYAVLNDVGAALFIIERIQRGRADHARQAGDTVSARRFDAAADSAFRLLADRVSLAQVWDPTKALFWSPAIGVRRDSIERHEDASIARFAGGETLWVYHDWDSVDNRWIPSGFEGETDAITVDETDPHAFAGKSAVRISYTPSRRPLPEGFAGVRWLYPENNFGDRPGGIDVRGAKRLVFMARADTVLVADFGFGGVKGQGGHTDYGDSMLREVRRTVRLTPQWQRIEFSLDTIPMEQLRRVVCGFWWETQRARSPHGAVYVDEIRFE